MLRCAIGPGLPRPGHGEERSSRRRRSSHLTHLYEIWLSGAGIHVSRWTKSIHYLCEARPQIGNADEFARCDSCSGQKGGIAHPGHRDLLPPRRVRERTRSRGRLRNKLTICLRLLSRDDGSRVQGFVADGQRTNGRTARAHIKDLVRVVQFPSHLETDDLDFCPESAATGSNHNQVLVTVEKPLSLDHDRELPQRVPAP